ncbi:MAG TPA: hypothetical protein VFM75_12885 [Modicisalibacter sp.]|nr:hypothetical protein [Modicisalibacter sp.]
MTTPLHRIRDLILPLLVNGTTWRHMLATAIHYRNEATDGDIEASLDELRDMGYVVVSDGERWWLETPEGAA